MNYEGSEVYARKSSYWDVPQTTADVCCYVLGVGTLILHQCPPPVETGTDTRYICHIHLPQKFILHLLESLQPCCLRRCSTQLQQAIFFQDNVLLNPFPD